MNDRQPGVPSTDVIQTQGSELQVGPPAVHVPVEFWPLQTKKQALPAPPGNAEQYLIALSQHVVPPPLNTLFGQAVVPCGHSQTQVSGFCIWPPGGQVIDGHVQAQVTSLRILGAGQVLVQTHCPLTQPLFAPVHGTPHNPQLVGVLLLTHDPPQQIWFGPQGVFGGRSA